MIRITHIKSQLNLQILAQVSFQVQYHKAQHDFTSAVQINYNIQAVKYFFQDQ